MDNQQRRYQEVDGRGEGDFGGGWRAEMLGVENNVVEKTETGVNSLGVAEMGRAGMGAASEVEEMGRGMMTGTGVADGFERVGAEMGAGVEQVERKAAAKLGRVERELENPESAVGEASALQKQEYLQEDEEDLRNELGQGKNRFEQKIVVSNEKKIAEEVAGQVENLVNQKQFRPADLDGIFRRGTIAALGVMNREIGERNNAV